MNVHPLTKLRRRMQATAYAIADTEERVAATLEQLAVNRPAEADRLQASATRAREFADTERRLAAAYGRQAGYDREQSQESPSGTTGESGTSLPAPAG